MRARAVLGSIVCACLVTGYATASQNLLAPRHVGAGETHAQRGFWEGRERPLILTLGEQTILPELTAQANAKPDVDSERNPKQPDVVPGQHSAINLFQIGAGVSTAIGLLGFALAVWLVWKIQRSRQAVAELKLVPERERTKILDEWLSRYKIDGGKLKADQKYSLIQEEMRRRFNYRALFLVVVVVAVVACFAIAVFGTSGQPAKPPAKVAQAPAEPASTPSNMTAYKSLEEKIRREVRLIKPGENPPKTDYVGVIRADLSMDGQLVWVTLIWKGGYRTVVSFDEAKELLLPQINDLKDKDPVTRGLPAIKEVEVANRELNTPGLIGPVTFPSNPSRPLQEVVAARKSLPKHILYFVEGLPTIDGVKVNELYVVKVATAAWEEVADVDFYETNVRKGATYVISCGLLPAGSPDTDMASSSIGPPLEGEEIRLVLDKTETWTRQSLEATVSREIGHILGLTNSTTPNQLMNPASRGIVAPQSEDIRRVQEIWGKR